MIILGIDHYKSNSQVNEKLIFEIIQVMNG